MSGVTPGVTEGAALEMKDVTLTSGYTTGNGDAVLIQNSGSGIFTRVLFKGNTAVQVSQFLLLLIYTYLQFRIVFLSSTVFITYVTLSVT